MTMKNKSEPNYLNYNNNQSHNKYQLSQQLYN